MEGYAYDVLANMKMAFEVDGRSGFYFGYSLGSVQMMIALTKFEEELREYVAKAIFLAPCTTMGNMTARPFESLSVPGALMSEF